MRATEIICLAIPAGLILLLMLSLSWPKRRHGGHDQTLSLWDVAHLVSRNNGADLARAYRWRQAGHTGSVDLDQDCPGASEFEQGQLRAYIEKHRDRAEGLGIRIVDHSPNESGSESVRRSESGAGGAPEQWGGG